jgi:hypothetical protein
MYILIVNYESKIDDPRRVGTYHSRTYRPGDKIRGIGNPRHNVQGQIKQGQFSS